MSQKSFRPKTTRILDGRNRQSTIASDFGSDSNSSPFHNCDLSDCCAFLNRQRISIWIARFRPCKTRMCPLYRPKYPLIRGALGDLRATFLNLGTQSEGSFAYEGGSRHRGFTYRSKLRFYLNHLSHGVANENTGVLEAAV